VINFALFWPRLLVRQACSQSGSLPAAKTGAKITDDPYSQPVLMGIFRKDITLEAINNLSRNTMAEQIGIEFTVIGDDFLEATMPVDSRTQQPFGLLHGGASVALAETLGSVAATCCVDPEKQFCVGLEINANHLKGARTGKVKGTTKPIHIGKKTQVWEIRIVNQQEELVCISRITMAVLDKNQ
jgi:1,4-dihydroxy-2-naphthoyl-CoA hydrolase